MIAVKIEGEFDPVVADEEFHPAMMLLNNSAQQGKNFAMMDKPDGGKVLVNIAKITTVDDLDS